jgi:hypothetical protein
MQRDDNGKERAGIVDADLVLGKQKTGGGVREIYTIPRVTVLELQKLVGNQPSCFHYGSASLPLLAWWTRTGFVTPHYRSSTL